MAYVKFIRGNKANYQAESTHLDSVYFATDSHELLMNGSVYGVGDAVGDIAYNESEGAFTITYVGNTTSPTTITIPESTSDNPGLMSAEDKQNLESLLSQISNITASVNITGSDAISVTGTDAKVVALTINSSDLVLSQSAEGLLANISLTWSTSDGLKLIGKDSTEIASIPASDFIKDGMLDNVELIEATAESPVNGLTSGTYMVFTFNTDAGSKVIYLDVTNLIDIYTAGNGIEVNNKEISVKISSSDEGFLKVSVDGIYTEGILNAIQQAVSESKSEIDSYTVNSKAINTNPVLNGADIVLTGYTDTDLINATDTINEAIAKLDNQLIWNEA